MAVFGREQVKACLEDIFQRHAVTYLRSELDADMETWVLTGTASVTLIMRISQDRALAEIRVETEDGMGFLEEFETLDALLDSVDRHAKIL